MNERHILQHMYYMHCIVHCIYVQCIPTLHTIIICITYNYIQCHRECRAPPPPCMPLRCTSPLQAPSMHRLPFAIGPASIERPSPYHRRVVQCIQHDTVHTQYNTYKIQQDTIQHETIRYDTIRYDTIRYGTTGYDTITYALPAR